MKQRVTSILFLVLVVHIAVSLMFILDPPFLNSTRLSRIYKTYLLPGPFFTDARIVDNYSLFISWKMNGKWIPPINPARDNFNHYHSTLNPTELYRSRMDRTFYLRLSFRDSSKMDIKNRKEFYQLTQYLYDRYIPTEADSVRILIINKQAKNFNLNTTDSVNVVLTK